MVMMRPNFERGSAVLLMLGLVLPILWVLFSLTLDLSTIFSDRAQEQAVVRQAALLGAKFLPDRTAASNAVTRYVAQYSPGYRALDPELRAAALQSSFGAGQLRVTLQLPAQLPVAPLSARTGLKFSAKAALTPRDAVIFFDGSAYMAPAVDGEEFWTRHIQHGVLNLFAATRELDQSREWPAAEYFEQRFDLRNQPARQLVYTQQCFNPSFSAFKEAALLLYDKLSGTDLNSVGVLSGPDRTGRVFEVRAFGPAGFQGVNAEGAIDTEPYGAVQDRECLSAAESAFFGDGIRGGLQEWFEARAEADQDQGWELPPVAMRYGFPANSIDLTQTVPLAPGRSRTERLTDPETGVLLPTAERYRSAREAIWSRRVNPTRVVEIGQVLRAVGERLIAAETQAERRRELAQFSSASGYILLGAFPRSGGAEFPAAAVKTVMRQALRRLDQDAARADKRLALYLVVARHEGMLPASACAVLECPEFLAQFSSLQQFLEQQQAELEYLSITPIRAPDLSTVALDLMSYLPLTERGIILAN